MTNRELAHYWAHNEGSKEGSNFFCEKNAIYSYGYHFKIAEKVKDKNGETIFFAFNANGYSPTTAKHKSYTFSAIPIEYRRAGKVIDIPGCDWKNWEKVLEFYTKEISSKLAQAQRARTNKDYYQTEAFSLLHHLKNYLELVQKAGVKIDKRKIPKIWRDAMKNETSSIEEITEKAEKARKAELEAKRREDAATYREQIADLERWKDGDLKWFTGHMIDQAYLRINGHMVETSQGASVPVNEAKALWAMIKAGKDIRGVPCSGYRVLSMNGVLTIGCHEIPREEVFRVGQLLDKL